MEEYTLTYLGFFGIDCRHIYGKSTDCAFRTIAESLKFYFPDSFRQFKVVKFYTTVKRPLFYNLNRRHNYGFKIETTIECAVFKYLNGLGKNNLLDVGVVLEHMRRYSRYAVGNGNGSTILTCKSEVRTCFVTVLASDHKLVTVHKVRGIFRIDVYVSGCRTALLTRIQQRRSKQCRITYKGNVFGNIHR